MTRLLSLLLKIYVLGIAVQLVPTASPDGVLERSHDLLAQRDPLRVRRERRIERQAEDVAKARELANEVDKLIWAEGHSLPLFQSAGNVAVRSNLANFGPAGIGDLNVTKIGFMKP